MTATTASATTNATSTSVIGVVTAGGAGGASDGVGRRLQVPGPGPEDLEQLCDEQGDGGADRDDPDAAPVEADEEPEHQERRDRDAKRGDDQRTGDRRRREGRHRDAGQEQGREPEPGRVAAPVDAARAGSRAHQREAAERQRGDPRDQEHDHLAGRLVEEGRPPRVADHAAHDRRQRDPRRADRERRPDRARVRWQARVRDAPEERDAGDEAAQVRDDRGADGVDPALAEDRPDLRGGQPADRGDPDRERGRQRRPVVAGPRLEPLGGREPGEAREQGPGDAERRAPQRERLQQAGEHGRPRGLGEEGERDRGEDERRRHPAGRARGRVRGRRIDRLGGHGTLTGGSRPR